VETNLWIALVGASASVVAAVVSLFAAARSARLKVQSDLAIERLRLDAVNRQKAFDVAMKEVQPMEAALSSAWRDIQTIRDVIQRTVAPAQYDEQVALDTLRSAIAAISSGYSQFGGMLPPEAVSAWHSAKSHTSAVEPLMLSRGTGVNPQPEADPDVDEQLLQLRSALRDHQSVLQQSLLTIRGTVMNRIMDAVR